MFHKLVMKISNNIVWGNLEKKYTGLAENAKYEMTITVWRTLETKVWRTLEASSMSGIITDGSKFSGLVQEFHSYFVKMLLLKALRCLFIDSKRLLSGSTRFTAFASFENESVARYLSTSEESSDSVLDK